jgi:hypothetical protein
MICPTGIADYFASGDWTGQITLEFLGKLVFWRRPPAPESRRFCNRAADLPVVGEIGCHLSRFAAVTRSSAAKIVVRYSW